jgi:2-isopropylmalate synthase
MQRAPITKYHPVSPIDLPDRRWPSRVVTEAPRWCSVDLRDGNQALAIPMSVRQKLELFQLLVAIGFKEIEVGFPSASQIEFDFVRTLIEDDLIPEDVTIQLLVQAREELIERTFESIRGAKRTVVHLYNSTSPLQRRVVFGLDKPEIIEIATRGTEMVKELAGATPGTRIVYQYSPESFSSTEVEFALEICEAVVDVWQPTAEDRIILNLPATVEVATPNVHADQIEWFCRHLRVRDTAIISLHTHNDRGTGVAATELGLLAGGERVEGTLFGNGERTGNVDIITVALNLYMQGVDAELDLQDIEGIRRVYERCTLMEVPPRHPYAGELVFTAFSGSHQDAIKKGMDRQDQNPAAPWEVPYLPIDPQDIGRDYEAIIRINSQSGKGGVAYVMSAEWGFDLPKAMHPEFGRAIARLADASGEEISAEEIRVAFEKEYLRRNEPIRLDSFHARDLPEGGVECVAHLSIDGEPREIAGHGNGPINAFVLALDAAGIVRFDVASYAEHSLEHGADAKAVAYVQIETSVGFTCFGAGIDTDIEQASIKAIVSALDRALTTEGSGVALGQGRLRAEEATSARAG